jgi:hypothetical protein
MQDSHKSEGGIMTCRMSLSYAHIRWLMAEEHLSGAFTSGTPAPYAHIRRPHLHPYKHESVLHYLTMPGLPLY